ncbi:putative two-component response regulator [Gordonia amicalis NBRC 100051 = JCM 11271]|nr:putative two-component response regulator [Gordonia amicalis NBRC 100051 = JCM 11271]
MPINAESQQAQGNTGPITVVVADDQAMVRQGFSALLAAQPDLSVLGDAADGVEAVEVCRRARPDVVLMDVRMPRKDGLWAAEQILSAGLEPPTRVLMLTTFDIDDYVYEALRIGASGSC